MLVLSYYLLMQPTIKRQSQGKNPMDLEVDDLQKRSEFKGKMMLSPFGAELRKARLSSADQFVTRFAAESMRYPDSKLLGPEGADFGRKLLSVSSVADLNVLSAEQIAQLARVANTKTAECTPDELKVRVQVPGAPKQFDLRRKNMMFDRLAKSGFAAAMAPARIHASDTFMNRLATELSFYEAHPLTDSADAGLWAKKIISSAQEGAADKSARQTAIFLNNLTQQQIEKMLATINDAKKPDKIDKLTLQ